MADVLADIDAKVDNATMATMVEGERSRLLAAQECNGDVACWRKKLVSTDANVRERAAYEVGWRGAKEAKDDLIKAAADDNAEVRMAAVLSLGRLGGGDPKQLEGIYEQSKNREEYVGVNQELQRLIARSKSAQKR